MNKVDIFLNKIRKHDITVGIIGLGYVGLPLAQAKIQNEKEFKL
jgi:UDP-N-acetyl-D-mannosaminuronate dehydrogenase